jgi:hypothetical protein
MTLESTVLLQMPEAIHSQAKQRSCNAVREVSQEIFVEANQTKGT